MTEPIETRNAFPLDERHPDVGGTHEGFAHIQRARDYALEELKAR